MRPVFGFVRGGNGRLRERERDGVLCVCGYGGPYVRCGCACVRACSLALTLCVRALALSLAFAGEGRGLLQRQRRTADIELRPVSPQWVTATGRSPACSALATRPALFFVQGRDTFSEAWPPVHEMRDRKTTRLHLPLHLLFPPVLSEWPSDAPNLPSFCEVIVRGMGVATVLCFVMRNLSLPPRKK